MKIKSEIQLCSTFKALDIQDAELPMKLWPGYWQSFENLVRQVPDFKSFVDSVPDDFKGIPINIDIRLQNLSEGRMSTAFINWHLDSVSSTEVPVKDNDKVFDGLIALINGDICPTKFALGEVEVPDYLKCSNFINDLSSGPKLVQGLKQFEAPTNTIIRFNGHTLHSGNKAKVDGKRIFIRVSKQK